MAGRRKSQEAGRSGYHESRSERRMQGQDSRARNPKRRRSRSPSDKSPHRKYHKHYHKGKRSSGKEDRNYKLDAIFNWVKSSQQPRHRSVSGRSSSRTSTKDSDSNYSKRSAYSKGRSCTSGGRKSHDISSQASTIRSVVVPVGTAQNEDQQQQASVGDMGTVDSLTARLNALRAEGLPKPVTGPAVSEDLAPILNVFLSKSEFVKTMKLCDKYPRPSNIDQLNIPELPKDASKIIDQKAVKNDDRFKNDQKCIIWGIRQVLRCGVET